MSKPERKNTSLEKNRQRRTGTKQRYTREQKIAAVTAARTVGRDFPMSNAAVTAARQVVGYPISLQTLSNWLTEFGPLVESAIPELAPRPTEAIVAETRDSILADLVKIQKKAINHLINSKAIDQSSARDASVVLGVTTDKIKAMTDIDPAISTIVRRLMDLCQRTNIDPVSLFEDFESIVQSQLPAIKIEAAQLPANTTDT